MSIKRGSDTSSKDRYPALAAALRARRASLGMSRKELAAQTKLSYPYISQLEGGYRAPSLGTARRLAHVLQMPLDDLVALADDEATDIQGTSVMSASPSGVHYDNPKHPVTPAPPMPESAMMAAGEPPSHRPRHDPFNEIVVEVLSLLARIPAEQRLEALSRIQSDVLNDVVNERSRK